MKCYVQDSFRLTPVRQFLAVLFAALIAMLPAVEAATYSLTYDANGNLVTGDGKYRVYDSFNRLSRIYNGSDTSGTLLQEYTFHPAEDRILVKKTYNSTGSVTETVTYVSDSFVRVVNTSGTYNTTYILANGQQIAQVLPDSSTQYLLTDIEGSVVVTTNSTGGIAERTTYTPYGDVSSGGTKTRFDYEGRESDSLVDDTDFRFRKYKPEWGLFTKPDDIIQDMHDPQLLNRFSFERNNPHKAVDPSGHMVLAVDWTVVIGRTDVAATPPPQTTELATRPAGQGFESGFLPKFFRQLGYRNIKDAPADSPVARFNRPGGFQEGGMYREIGDGAIDTIRWDSGHAGYPNRHLNQEGFRLLDNGKWQSLGEGPLDHADFFGFGAALLPGQDSRNTPTTQTSIESGCSCTPAYYTPANSGSGRSSAGTATTQSSTGWSPRSGESWTRGIRKYANPWSSVRR